MPKKLSSSAQWALRYAHRENGGHTSGLGLAFITDKRTTQVIVDWNYGHTKVTFARHVFTRVERNEFSRLVWEFLRGMD